MSSSFPADTYIQLNNFSPQLCSKGGNFVLRIPGALWIIIQQNRGFEGIEPAPQSKPNDDGSFTVTLTPAQWQIFQDNQKKPPVPVPAGGAAPAAAPAGTAPEAQPSPGDISVQQDSSTFILCFVLVEFSFARN